MVAEGKATTPAVLPSTSKVPLAVVEPVNVLALVPERVTCPAPSVTKALPPEITPENAVIPPDENALRFKPPVVLLLVILPEKV